MNIFYWSPQAENINLMIDSGPKARSCPLTHFTTKTIPSSVASPKKKNAINNK